MNKLFRGILIVLVCGVMSLPFAFLLWWNLTPGPAPYGRTHTDSSFTLADVVFYIQHLLSLIVLFLMYVRSVDSNSEKSSPFGIAAGVIGVLSLVGSFMLTWKGEIVNVGLKHPSSFARLISHPDKPSALFYGALTAIWLGIVCGSAAALLSAEGKSGR